MSTWETTTDWDNSTSESGVAHESVTNTDHNDSTIVKQGYSYSNFDEIAPNPVSIFPLHENSGSVANDLSGNNNDGTINGATLGQTGILGTTAFTFDGIDDYISLPDTSLDHGDTITVTAWIKTSTSVRQVVYRQNPNGSYIPTYNLEFRNGNLRFQYDDSNSELTSGFNFNGNWRHIAAVYDKSNNQATLYLDGSSQATASHSISSTTSTPLRAIGRYDNGNGGDGGYFTGEIADVRVYNTALSTSQIQTLYDVVNTPGTLTTATKSFANSATPNLQNLSYTLNGATDIKLDIIGSPGTGSEEIVTQQLDGSSSYSLSWSNTHTDFRVKLYPHNEGIVTRGVSINKIELSATASSTTSLIWETTTDWDSGQSETGVHHEKPTGTDWAASNKVEKGYPSFDENGSSLVSYLPMNESSGPVNDVANGNTYSVSNGTFGKSGVFGEPCIDFPNGTTQDEINLGSVLDGITSFTCCIWFNRPSSAGFPTSAGDETIISAHDDLNTDNNTGWELYVEDSNDTYKLGTSQEDIVTGVNVSDDNWDFIVITYDGTTAELFINDTSQGTVSENYDIGNSHNSYIGHGTQQSEERNLTGRVQHFRFYSRVLSSSEITDLYQAAL